MDSETREEKIPENIDQWTNTNVYVCAYVHMYDCINTHLINL